MATLRRISAARICSTANKSLVYRPVFTQLRHASSVANDPDVTDPNMNGGYINPPPGKRALRDPYADWWDKQERRNFGEPIHEDNDIYAMFSPEPYTHMPPGKAALHLLVFVGSVLGLSAVVYQFYPDQPAAPRTWSDGLEGELGGKRALLARTPEEENP